MPKSVRKQKAVASDVTIFRMKTGWGLCIAVTADNKTQYKKYTFDKLIEAIAAASVLKMHINNVDQLPIRQYRQVA